MTFLQQSLYLGFVISILAYLCGVWLKKKLGWAILNPLLVASILVIIFLAVFRIDYQTYNEGAKYLSYLLTPVSYTHLKKISVFGESHIDEAAREHGIKVLARIPIDPKVAAMVDGGRIEYVEAPWLDDAVKAAEEI